MNNVQAEQLFGKLLRADSEDEVIDILDKAGVWNDPESWREYGDRSGNFSTIGNQQSRPDAALVEKIINSVDARLTNECLLAGMDPTSPEAPQSIREAIARFFEHRNGNGNVGGTLRDWSSKQRREEAGNITLAATGTRRSPCLTLVDTGEGQTPDRMPDTFLSIDKENKLRIPFVQGKFNMGGTGALKFCGQNHIQLIITRRNPALAKQAKTTDASSNQWGFTIVRRELPVKEAGAVRNSVYTYLAPVDAEKNPHHGRVLRFTAPTLKLMPHHNLPYERAIEWGSAIKLYNYDMKGFESHILLPDGLLYRLEALLPEVALPVRLHECRDYSGKSEASFVTPLAGLVVRLEDGKGDNIEKDFPSSVPFTVKGEEMTAKIYAFKKGRADTYRTNEGVIFYINGQTHGAIPKTLFQRKSVNMNRLADSLLVLVDCSTISIKAREDLFMNSRDRLSLGELRKAVERQLEEVIGNHPGLRALREKRRTEEIAARLADEKPLEDVLGSILKSSPSLASLFLRGNRLGAPHKQQNQTGKGNGLGENGEQPFTGKPHPTFFRFNKRRYGELFEKEVEVGRRCRLKFETDVVNDYFIRSSMPGRYHVEIVDGLDADTDINHSLTLHNGFGHWSIELPEEAVVGSKITILCTVADDVNPEGFTNTAKLTVIPYSQHESSSSTRKSKTEGATKDGQEEDAGIQMPYIILVKEPKWAEHKFDKNSACRVIPDETGEGNAKQRTYTFYVNVDNIFLRTDMKGSKEDPKVVETKFIYGNVLIGLALIQDAMVRDKLRKSLADGTEDTDVEQDVERITRALAPFIVPMINSLGALTAEDIASLGQVGDEE